MQLVKVRKLDTDELFLGIKITKNDQAIFRDLGSNFDDKPNKSYVKSKIKKDRIKNRQGQIINYVTLQTIKQPYTYNEL